MIPLRARFWGSIVKASAVRYAKVWESYMCEPNASLIQVDDDNVIVQIRRKLFRGDRI